MTQLTTNEKIAIVTILSQIMNADGVIHPKEEEYMDNVYIELGLKIGDIENMDNIDDIQARQIIQTLSNEQKLYVFHLFISMAESDGFVHPKEHAIIEQLFGEDFPF